MPDPPTWREVIVVVPHYNEAARLRIDDFRDYAARNPRTGFLIVDDGSTDGTGDLIRDALSSGDLGLRLHSLPENQGKAEAVRVGMRRALEADPLMVGYWDADLATPLGELDGMLRVLDDRHDLDAVLGSRVRLLGHDVRRSPWRHYLGRVFATVASLILELPVYDTQCGAKLFRTGPVLRSALAEPFQSRWIFDVELLARLHAARGASIVERLVEYPLREWRDVAGSKLGPMHMARAGVELVGIRSSLRRARGRRG
jgi:glycosyltransferase involved in cell wall biosynthesis